MVKGKNSTHLRCSSEFDLLIHEIKLEYKRQGRSPPSTAEITKQLSNELRKNGILQGRFIRF